MDEIVIAVFCIVGMALDIAATLALNEQTRRSCEVDGPTIKRMFG
jgi:hypothetical protein